MAEAGIVLASQDSILDEAKLLVEQAFGETPLKAAFDSIMAETDSIAYQVYLEHERTYAGQVVSKVVLDSIDNVDPVDWSRKLEGLAPVLDSFFMSLAQGRKSRGGAAFEYFLRYLFKKLEYPFSEQPVLVDSKPDFILPSIEEYHRNPLNCVVFTAKRTLRERWRQITSEGSRGIGQYLATIDAKISPKQLELMRDHKIYLIVPEALRLKHYRTFDNVISFARFFEDHLDAKQRIWNRDGFAKRPAQPHD